MKNTYLLWLLCILFVGCQDDSADYEDLPLAVQVPSNFPALVYDISANPPTQKGFELGKKLFYDGRLASDGVVSCGFCHLQEHAFTHHGHTLSHGVDNQIGLRNTPPIQNLAYQTQYMWDGATAHLDLQPIIPLTSAVEMNGDLNSILTMMKGDPAYRKLFGQAFPEGGITTENMLKALSQFMVMAISANSKFDKFRRNEAGGTMTQAEMLGYELFNQKCASCHATDLMTDNSFRNNGLAINPLINDTGRYMVTGVVADKYKFKVPSLRNIEKTAPYMHDGRFGTLDAVLNHYSSGIIASGTLDPVLQQNGMVGISLTAEEKSNLITFLKTLTDNEYLTDARFSEF
ncbi:MAG: c-type cytochrome [Flavobacterium sp.]|nr:MAG: c-type cytochrome [Flavobacterium sp.]